MARRNHFPPPEKQVPPQRRDPDTDPKRPLSNPPPNEPDPHDPPED